MPKAKELYDDLSENSRALIEGYVTGYNKYLKDTGIENLSPQCQNQTWVKEITPQELTAYMFSTSQMASGLRFLELAFLANPSDGNEYLPYLGPRTSSSTSFNFADIINNSKKFKVPQIKNEELGSNAWAIGKDHTEDDKGILLANPHFPHTGHLRFWQSHITIPGVLDVQGAALQGLPGIVNIGFNQNLAWSHTVSASNRFAGVSVSVGRGFPTALQVR